MPTLSQAKFFFQRWKGHWLAYLLVALAMTPEALRGERPVSHDHTIHYARAWQFIHDLLPRLKIWDWSYLWHGGYPTNYNYPFLADWLIGAVHGLSFGLLPLGFAYTVAVIFSHWLEGYAVYRLGKSLGHPRAGFWGGLFHMSHIGGSMVGGWFWTHYAGVWPVSLSVSLSLLAVAYLPSFFRDPNRRGAAWMGLFWGAALLAHPLQQIHLAVFAPLMVGSLWLLPPSDRGRRLRLLAVSVGIGLGIGALWFLPFLATSGFAERFPDVWGPLTQIMAEAWEGKLFLGVAPVIQFAGFVGIIAFALSGEPTRLVVGAGCLLLILFGSTTFFDFFRLEKISDGFGFIQYHRFQMILKPYWCLAAGIWLGKACEALIRSWPRPLPTGFRRIQILAAIGLTVALGLTGLGPSLRDYTFAKVSNSQPVRRHSSYEALVDWLLAREREESRFYRVAVFNRGDTNITHELQELVTRVHTPLICLAYLPSVVFKYQTRSPTDALFKLLSVRYLVADTEAPPGLSNANWTAVARVGAFFVFENGDWNFQRVSILGQGSLKSSTWDRHSVSVEVEPGSRGNVLLHLTYFSRWKAYWNGSPAPIYPYGVGPDLDLVSVPIPAEKGGRLEVRFELGWPEYLAVLLCLLALALTVRLFKGALR